MKVEIFHVNTGFDCETNNDYLIVANSLEDAKEYASSRYEYVQDVDETGMFIESDKWDGDAYEYLWFS